MKVLLLVVLLGLFVTNPSGSDFTTYVFDNGSNAVSNQIDRAVDILELEDTDQIVRGFLTGSSKTLAKLLLDPTIMTFVERETYLVFSLYKFDVSLLRDFGFDISDYIILGIANEFIIVSGDTEDIGRVSRSILEISIRTIKNFS